MNTPETGDLKPESPEPRHCCASLTNAPHVAGCPQDFVYLRLARDVVERIWNGEGTARDDADLGEAMHAALHPDEVCSECHADIMRNDPHAPGCPLDTD